MDSPPANLADPFVTPDSSRPPSLHSFPTRRTILTQAGFGSSSFSSARSSLARAASSNHLASGVSILNAHLAPGQVTPTHAHLNGQGRPSTPKKMPRMKSHMLTVEPGSVEKPWLNVKNPRAIVSYYIVYFIIFLGIAGGLVQSYFKYILVPLDKQPLCLVYEEDFNDGDEDRVFGLSKAQSGDLSGGTLFREVSMDGFGNNEFEMTTTSSSNSYMSNGYLYLNPTLTAPTLSSPDSLYDGLVYNLTGCTYNLTAPNGGFTTQPDGSNVFDQDAYLTACSGVSNKTTGAVINPVMSARVSTRFSASIQFGRVEVRAKMPNGDWLWPAIWMLPKDSVYGVWPRSGEIDMVESRGNSIRYTGRGSNYVQGSLNWGPSPELNSVSKTYSWWSDTRVSFGSGFHTYALEWTDKFLRVYVDSRLHTLLNLNFNEPFFKRGDYPSVWWNGSTPQALSNPWVNASVTNAAPFDQEFFLIMNLAVGGTSGWFPDGQGNKPWLNQAEHPMRDFAEATAEWYPTWPTDVDDRAMIIDYVKMWKHC